MKLTWTNTEWDNFSGVASQDNLLMLNAGDDFLNAGGDETLLSETEVKKRIRAIMTFRDRATKWTRTTAPSTPQVDGAKKYYRSIFPNIDKSSIDVLKSYLEKAENDKRDWASVQNNGESVMKYGASVNDEEISIVRNASKAKANIQALNDTIIPEIKNALDKVVALKEKADANAKGKAEADAKAKEDADAKAKMKSLTDQLLIAKTPEEKARIQAEIDALAGNVAKATGSSKTIVYAVAGLAIIGVAYMLLKRKA
jgi:LPXTG-motif cell wall-anchored protein